MHFEIPLLGLAVYLLFWDKLPGWGTWFNAILSRMPKIVRTTYGYWTCAYCSGFWISLCLHGVTGRWFIDGLTTLSFELSPIDPALAWFLDALAAGTVVYVFKTVIDVMKAANAAMGHSCSIPK